MENETCMGEEEMVDQFQSSLLEKCHEKYIGRPLYVEHLSRMQVEQNTFFFSRSNVRIFKFIFFLRSNVRIFNSIFFLNQTLELPSMI
jgi:hypothetical protein